MATEMERLTAAYLGGLRVAPRTVPMYAGDLKVLAMWLDAEGLSPLTCDDHDVSLYVQYIHSRGWQPDTISKRLMVMRGFFQWLLDTGQRQNNPASRVSKTYTRGRQVEVLTLDELRRVVEASRARPSGLAVVSMLAVCGLGVGEVTEAEVSDLRETATGWQLRLRSRDNDFMPLPTLVASALLEVVGARRRGPLLLSRNGTRLERTGVTRVTVRSGSDAGIEARVTPQMLTLSARYVAVVEGVSFLEIVQGLPRGLRRLLERAEQEPPAEQHLSARLATLVMADPSSTEGLLDQADQLAATPGVHPIAAITLASAAYEQHLRQLATAHRCLPRTGKGENLTQYAIKLLGAGVFTESYLQLNVAVVKARDDAVHGWTDRVDRETSRWLRDQVRKIIKAHPLPD